MAASDTQPAPTQISTDVHSKEQELSHRWEVTKQFLETLQNLPDQEEAVRHILAATQSALQAYSEAAQELDRLYTTDPYLKDRAVQTRTVFLEHCNLANSAIVRATEKACSLAMETMSNASRHSRASSRSSKSSSSAISARAQALATAAAAAENAAFEEVIAAKELERAKKEAESKLAEARHALEQQTQRATADADLRVLRAKQAAAVEMARSKAILQVEQEEMPLTTPGQSSNDHALSFRSRSTADPRHPASNQLRPTAPPYQPVQQNHDISTPSSELTNIIQPNPTEIVTGAANENQLVALTKEISDTLARQRQPAHEPDIYGGNPIMFQPWRASFQTMIDQAQTPATQKLAFLAKYTKGEVRDLVHRFRHRYVSNPQVAYDEAWKELEDRFGNKSKIAADIIQKLNALPKIKADERQRLLDFADSCVDAAAQMNDLPALNILNYPYNLHPLLEKLPAHIHNKWREHVTSYKSTHDSYPPFRVLAKFLKEKAKTSNDPDLYPPSSPAYKTPERKSGMTPANRPPLRVMATKGTPPLQQKPNSTARCLFHDVPGHDLSECIAFGRMPMAERSLFCKQKGLCFKCGQRHVVKECQTEVKCRKCDSKTHASFMHPPTNRNGGEQGVRPETEVEADKKKEDPPEANTKCTRYTSCIKARSCSKIVLVKVYPHNDPSTSVEAYAVLDDQSNACLGDPRLFQALNLNGPSYNYELSTCGGRQILTQGRRAQGLIMESLDGHKERLPTLLENGNIPSDREEIPSPDLCRNFPHLEQIANMIPSPRDDVDILLLIGRSCPEPLKVRESRNGPRGTPWAQRTNMGWTVSGRMCANSISDQDQVRANRTILVQTTPPSPLSDTNYDLLDYPPACKSHVSMKDMVKGPQNTHWGVYTETPCDNDSAPSVEDQCFLKIMTENAHTNPTGNLEFPLPFKETPTYLPNNRRQAESRMHNLVRTLSRKPDLMGEYRAFMGKILDKNHASPIPTGETPAPAGTVWYLPHFPVRHPKKTNIRVVFDSSAEFSGVSLNKVLLQGPDQINSLLGILLRFRVGRVAVMGDVEQMFHNFHVNPEHRNYLRFLWFQNNNPEEPIVDHRMNVHLFGNVSSPAIATFGIRMAVRDGDTPCDDDVSQFVCRDFYVDDGLTSQPHAGAAISLIRRTREALAKKKLRFHKIVSNSKDVMNQLPEESKAKDLQQLDLDQDILPTQRSLGVHWSLEQDAFTFIVDLPEKPFSRRGVLSIASSIFDPLGFVTPVTIEGKLILRELMAEAKKETNIPKDMWDRPLPDRFLPRWNRWRESLHKLQDVQVQRCYSPSHFGDVKRREVHIFCDASQLAIGAVAYLRLLNERSEPHVSLLLAKAKVTPSHAVSIPRLELCAAVLGIRLAQTLRIELEDRVTIDSTKFYSDSKVVLGYIANESRRFHVYVANRVHKIHMASNPNQWHHIPTWQNPADLASRTVSAGELNNTRWFHGPEMLWRPEASLTETTTDSVLNEPLDENDPEVRKITIKATDAKEETVPRKATEAESSLGHERFSRFSSWLPLRRAIGSLIRKVQTFKAARVSTAAPTSEDRPEEPSALTVQHLQQAENAVLKAVQSHAFREEIQALKSASIDDTATLTVKSPLSKLSPFLDSDGILRVGGRLKRSEMDLAIRHPIVLPKDCHVSELLAYHHHRRIHHQGRQLTLGTIRSAGLWIIGANRLVRSIINRCTTCRKLRQKPLTQVMADLPEDRVTVAPPFTNVGMDVFGPWTVVTRKTRGGTSDSKRWAVIFTCLYSRAIHAEVVESMDTSSFISALRRFVAIRGPVSKLRCDQGTNFVGAKNELNDALNKMDRNAVAAYLSSVQCQWEFNPPHASHFGGAWERQISSVRRVLDAMFLQLGKLQLTHEILTTFMAEACAIVNSRPLSTVPSDTDDPQAITPLMLLTLKPQQLPPPPGNFIKEDLYGRKRWRRVQYLADQFWLRWKREYVQSLQPRRKWPSVQPDLDKGDVVLLRDKELPRCQWPLARVTEVHPSQDGRVRKADVIVCRGGSRHTYLRPISELILIEKASTQE